MREILTKYFHVESFNRLYNIGTKFTDGNIVVEISKTNEVILTKKDDKNFILKHGIKTLDNLIHVFCLIELHSYNGNGVSFFYKICMKQIRISKRNLIQKQREENPKRKLIEKLIGNKRIMYNHVFNSTWSNCKNLANLCDDEEDIEDLSPSQINKLKHKRNPYVNNWDLYDQKNWRIDMKRLKRYKYKTVNKIS